MKYFSTRAPHISTLALLVLFLLPSDAFGLEYGHELRISADYDQSTGEVDSGGTTTKIDQNTIKSQMSYGYLASDTVEPFFDVTYATTADTIGTFKSSSTITDWGVGMLFNVPTVDESKLSKLQKKGFEKSATPLMSYATWIPYGGVVLASMSSTGTGGTAVSSDVSHNAIVTKLIFGTRYMIYPHVGLNFSVRAFYQDTQSEAKATTTESGGTKKLTVQTNLLSLTLFM